MAHPYTVAARVERLVAGQSTRLDDLLDRDEDGTADTDGAEPLIDDVIERACNRIDGEVAQVYVTPLTVDISAPAEAGLVADLCDKLAAAELFFWVDPLSEDGKRLQGEALDFLDMVRARRTGLPGQTPIDQRTGRQGVRYESIGTVAAGGVTSGRSDAAYSDDTTDQTRGL